MPQPCRENFVQCRGAGASFEKQELVRKMINQGLEPMPGVDIFALGKAALSTGYGHPGSRGTVSLALKNWAISAGLIH